MGIITFAQLLCIRALKYVIHLLVEKFGVREGESEFFIIGLLENFPVYTKGGGIAEISEVCLHENISGMRKMSFSCHLSNSVETV